MKKIDVAEYGFHLEDNLFNLQRRLKAGTWEPDTYSSFYISDPKLRHIHKASVRDRVCNQALFRVLYPIFEPTFIHDSYSCRNKKGTHKGVERLGVFLRRSSQNHTRPVFALQCDIKQFFDSISHDILLDLIAKKIKDPKLLQILELVVHSFETAHGIGLPLGNVTSQLFTNVYLNPFDQYVKHVLKEPYYIRYCDDFIILNTNRERLESLVPLIAHFLEEELSLTLHPNKISIRNINQGIDFLGYVSLPHYRVLRTSTKKRMFRNMRKLRKARQADKISHDRVLASLNSYRGILSHCKGHTLTKKLDESL